MKTIIAVMLILIAGPLFAADVWYKSNQLTLAWDSPTTYEDGSLIDTTTDPVTYQLYIKNDKTGVETLIGTVSGTQSPVVVPSKGWWRFGIAALQTGNYASLIAWSSAAISCLNGETFGVRNLGPSMPYNLKGTP